MWKMVKVLGLTSCHITAVQLIVEMSSFDSVSNTCHSFVHLSDRSLSLCFFVDSIHYFSYFGM